MHAGSSGAGIIASAIADLFHVHAYGHAALAVAMAMHLHVPYKLILKFNLDRER